MLSYLPALVETINIAAVSTILGAAVGGVMAMLSTRGMAPSPRLVPVFRRLMDIVHQAADHQPRRRHPGWISPCFRPPRRRTAAMIVSTSVNPSCPASGITRARPRKRRSGTRPQWRRHCPDRNGGGILPPPLCCAELIAFSEVALTYPLMLSYLPALVETINIAAVSTILGAAVGGVMAMLSTRGMAPSPRLVPVFRRLMDDVHQAALGQHRRHLSEWTS